jgi:hypothetical protein
MRRRSLVSPEADSDRVDATSAQRDGWARARWRLRDLRGRDRVFAVALLVLLLVPFAVALVRAFHDGWVPSGDEANIATRALAVFSRKPPLTGLPSTSGLYGEKITTNHPGPIEFYLLAVPLRVLGMTAGPLLTAAAINAAFVLITAWVFFRRLGVTAMLWAGVLLLAVMWSGGTAVLTDTLSSNMTMYSVLCTAVLAWALIDGDVGLLPLAAFVASYAAQQHLAAGLIVLVLGVVVIVSLVAHVLLQVRRHEAIGKITLWGSLAALAVAAVCWTPVIIDEITGHPGNLTAIVKFGRDSTRPTLGFKSGIYQALHAVAPPTILGRTDTSGAFFLGAPGAARIALGLVVLGALIAVAIGARRRSPGLASLSMVALVLLAAGIINGSNVPRGVPIAGAGTIRFESDRVNLYRWSWAAAFVTWTALGIACALLVRHTLVRAGNRSSITVRASRLGPPALLATAALIATSIVFIHGRDDHNREVPEFAAEKRIDQFVLASIDRHRPVLVTSTGNDAYLSVGPHLILRLIEAGVKVEVPSLLNDVYGSGHVYQPQDHPISIAITSGRAQLPPGRGKLLALEPLGPTHTAEFDTLFAARTALINDLTAAAMGAKVELAPGANALIDRERSKSEQREIRLDLAFLPSDPRVAFEDTTFLKLVSKGMLRSPVVDQAKVRRLLALHPYSHRGTWGDEEVFVQLLTPAETELCLHRTCFRSE